MFFGANSLNGLSSGGSLVQGLAEEIIQPGDHDPADESVNEAPKQADEGTREAQAVAKIVSFQQGQRCAVAPKMGSGLKT